MRAWSKRSPLAHMHRGTKSHPHRASAGPDCCSAGASGPAMQHGGGSKLKGLLRVPLRLPCSWALPLMNIPYHTQRACHIGPCASLLVLPHVRSELRRSAVVRPAASTGTETV